MIVRNRLALHAAAPTTHSGLEFDSTVLPESDRQVLSVRGGRPVLVAGEDASGNRVVTRIWYRRPGLSSDWLWPYHDRFWRALALLRQRGITVPRARLRGRVPERRAAFVVCDWLEGTPLREHGRAIDLRQLAVLLLRLHDLGIYSRGLNLGNVILQPDGELGLIDASDIKFLARPLPRRMRERSLGILCSHPGDLALMQSGVWSELVMAYCRAAGMTLTQAARMRDRVRVQVERRSRRRAFRKSRPGAASPVVGGADFGSVKTH